MKVLELAQDLVILVYKGHGDSDVVIHSGGEDVFGYSPVKEVEVRKAVDDVGIDGPFRLEDKGDKEVVALFC